MNGKVKWYDVKKGFGFITGDCGSDFFVHHSDIKCKTLADGDHVTFDVAATAKGEKAILVEQEQYAV